MDNNTVSNPNDFKVVSFHNSEEFGFTADMGCMYDGKPINGTALGIASGETKVLPYHVAHQLALNLAKYSMNHGSTSEVQKDALGNPIVKAIWDVDELDKRKNSYITEMYSEDRPIQMTEAQRLLEKVAELEKLVNEKVISVPEVRVADSSESSTKVYLDKAEVIAELEKQGIQHDKRKKKEELEALLTS